jgi:hypothetical protein
VSRAQVRGVKFLATASRFSLLSLVSVSAAGFRFAADSLWFSLPRWISCPVLVLLGLRTLVPQAPPSFLITAGQCSISPVFVLPRLGFLSLERRARRRISSVPIPRQPNPGPVPARNSRSRAWLFLVIRFAPSSLPICLAARLSGACARSSTRLVIFCRAHKVPRIDLVFCFIISAVLIWSRAGLSAERVVPAQRKPTPSFDF